MAPPSHRSARGLGERGAITWVTALLIAGLAGSAYLAVVWFPVYVVHYEVKAVVRDFGNQAVKNPDDAGLVSAMCLKLRALDSTRVLGADGRTEQVPSVEVQPQEVLWERDRQATPPTLRVAFDYRRDVYYPLLDRWTEKLMRVDLTMDVALPNWGPAR